MEQSIGDSHNFSRTVHFTEGGLVFKPRPLYWEWLFLSTESPLRQFLENEFLTKNLPCGFDLIPLLKFYNSPKLNKEGEVEKFYLDSEKIPKLSLSEYEKIGSLIGILTWFGVSDLHSDNFLIGEKNKKFIILPIDIESIFNNFILPSQSLIIPSSKNPQLMYGFKFLFKHFSQIESHKHVSIPQILYGFLSTVNHLNTISDVLTTKILKQPVLRNTPIRVILRKTKVYEKALKQNRWPKDIFIKEEIEQLERGDIPYFFRYLPSGDIYSYSSKDLLKVNLLNVSLLEKKFQNTFDQNSFITSSFEEIRHIEILNIGGLQLLKELTTKILGNEQYSGKYKNIEIKISTESVEYSYKKGKRFVCKKS